MLYLVLERRLDTGDMPTPTWLAFLPHKYYLFRFIRFLPIPSPHFFFWVVFFNEIVYISQVMKRNLSSFDIYVIVSELQNLVDGYVDKIYQLSRSEILFRFKKKDKYQVYVRNGELICTTDKKLETPTKPSTFCMTLRKYLQNGKITGVSQHEFDRIIKIDIGKKEGATMVCGGEEYSEGYCKNGFFYKPTVFVDVKPNMRIFQEEIFGPVLSVSKVNDFDEAVKYHNNTVYGLSSSIYTNDVDLSFRAMRDLDAGITYINGPTIGAECHMPFGGVKETVNGHREGGWEVYEFFSETKTIYVDFSGRLQKAQIDNQ